MTDLSKTLKDRGNIHGAMECNAQVTQELLGILLEQGYASLPKMHRECIHMILHKISRLICGEFMNADSAHDIAGYATLLEQWIEEQNNEEL